MNFSCVCQVQDSEASPELSRKSAAGPSKPDAPEQNGVENDVGAADPPAEGGSDEGGPPKPATGQGDEHGHEATGDLPRFLLCILLFC